MGLDINSTFTALILTHGKWYWINVGYSYLLLFVSTILLLSFIPTLKSTALLYRGQIATLLIALFTAWVSTVGTVSGLNPFPHLDLTPFAFTITGVAMAWNIFHFRLLDITPVARNAVVESMSDAVIVLDQQNRITDLNPAAQRLLGQRFSALVGQPAAQVFSVWPEQYEINLLTNGFRTLIKTLQLDYLLIDTHPGLNEETLLSLLLSDILVLLLRPDQQDFQGTAVTVEVARKLNLKRLLLVVNNVLPTLDADSLRCQVETSYEARVAGLLPASQEMIALGSAGIFSLRYPDHPYSQGETSVHSK